MKGGPNHRDSDLEDLCLVNVSVKYFSKLYFGTNKIQLEFIILEKLVLVVFIINYHDCKVAFRDIETNEMT